MRNKVLVLVIVLLLIIGVYYIYYNKNDEFEHNDYSEIIVSLKGILEKDGVDITNNQEVGTENLGNLTFEPDTNWNEETSFSWNGSNGIAYATTTADVKITIAASSAAVSKNWMSWIIGGAIILPLL